MRAEIRLALKSFREKHGDINDDEVESDRNHCDIYVRYGVTHEAFPTAIRKATADDPVLNPATDIVVEYYDIVDDNYITLDVDDLQLDALMAALELTELWYDACVEDKEPIHVFYRIDRRMAGGDVERHAIRCTDIKDAYRVACDLNSVEGISYLQIKEGVRNFREGTILETSDNYKC